MKCIILLSLVALCYSYPYGSGYGSGYGYGYSPLTESILGNGNIYTNEDGSVSITTGNGKRVTISKVVDQNGVVITTVPTGQFQKYASFKGYQPTQADILAQILNQYQGSVNENAYQQFLEDVNSAVQSGQLSNSVYQTLQNLYQNQRGYYGNQFQTPIEQLYQQVPYQVGQNQRGYYGNQVSYLSNPFQSPVEQLYQQVQSQQGYPVYGFQQQNQYPYQTAGIQAAFVPVGLYQQGQVTYPGFVGTQKFLEQPGVNYGNGKNLWSALTSGYLYDNEQQKYYVPYGQYSQYPQQYPQQFVQTTVGQLPQIVEGEKQLLNEQNQIQQKQVQQQQQQEQILVQQVQQQQEQKQQQNQQEKIGAIQEQVQQGQDQVLAQQNPQYVALKNILQNIWQQQPSVYSQGKLNGVYPGGYNTPLVV